MSVHETSSLYFAPKFYLQGSSVRLKQTLANEPKIQIEDVSPQERWENRFVDSCSRVSTTFFVCCSTNGPSCAILDVHFERWATRDRWQQSNWASQSDKGNKANLFCVSRGLNSLQHCCKYRYCCSGHTSLRPHLPFAYVMHDLIKRMRERCVPGSFFLLPLEPGYEANYMYIYTLVVHYVYSTASL